MKKFLSYFVYYVVQWTWGIVMNIVGFVAFLVGLCCREKVGYCGPCVYIYSRYCRGCAFSLGMFVVLGYDSDECMPHEVGHSIQNMIFGPLMPFVVGIPSCVRFWYREVQYKKGKGHLLPDYDSIWFEGLATKWGEYWYGVKWSDYVLMRNNK